MNKHAEVQVFGTRYRKPRAKAGSLPDQSRKSFEENDKYVYEQALMGFN